MVRTELLLFASLLLLLAGCSPEYVFIGDSQLSNNTLTLSPTDTPPSNVSAGTLYVDNTTPSYELCVYNGNNWTSVSSGGVCS